MFLKGIFFSTLLSALVAVLCVDKELCDFSDDVCLTNSTNHWLKFIVVGNQSFGLQSSEPLYVKTINASLCHYMNYSFTDVYLYGMKDCAVHKLKFFNDSSWKYYLICPRLIFKADYVENGMFDSVPVEGKGKVILTFDNVHMDSHGEVETITGFDGKPHMNITYYKIDLLESKDKVTYEFASLFSTDKEKSEKTHKFLDENCKKISDDIKFPVMYLFMGQFLNNINKFLTLVPKYEMFYKNP